eukprot:CAMPEP_0178420920 /NCGR_PEP_ID=MMETSP0689_2-20121128/26384_1 /TAXON_ID=160604 /ORGANISM="Amphidinium massartii, Strain CS-259" /LENGTH=377 /DNA_ID=CAMNT_0020042423 /DNA_START=57 /DNA_END=1187 /DNA_ORIENTATION=+
MSTSAAPPGAVAHVLPHFSIDVVLGLLQVHERGRCRLLGVIWRDVCCEVDSRVTSYSAVNGNEAFDLRRFDGSLKRLVALQILDLDGQATDDALRTLQGVLPSLQCLRCTRSKSLTDDGVRSLVEDAASRSQLREVDLTFSRNTSFAVTIALRRAIPSLQVIRRQPRWLDGHFLTPFKSDRGANITERHTYYADGSFQFTREEQSRGYVKSLEESASKDFLTNSLRYCNFGPSLGLPFWAQFCYYPSVALKPVPGNNPDVAEDSMHSVLVAQALSGIAAPAQWPAVESEQVPLGQSVFLQRDGSILPPGMEIQTAVRDYEAYLMVSRMEVLPLETPMPSEALVSEIDDFERSRMEFEAEHAQDVRSVMERRLVLYFA